MDPNQAMVDMVVAASHGMWITMLETAEELSSWLQKGGSRPDIDMVREALTRSHD